MNFKNESEKRIQKRTESKEIDVETDWNIGGILCL